MSNSKDYIITTLSNNLSQRSNPVFSQAVNSSVSLRDKCSPYTVVATPGGDEDEVIVKFPFGCLGPQSYIQPFVYYDMETSSSTAVAAAGANDYTGILSNRVGGSADINKPHYTTENVFRGTYSLAFGKTDDHADYVPDYAWVDFGTPLARTNWNTLFSDSWSISFWYRPGAAWGTAWQYDGFFHLKDPTSSNYSFMLVLGDNSGSGAPTSPDGPVGFYVDNTTLRWNFWDASVTTGIGKDVWNHVVFAISGSTSDPTNRYIKAIINGVDIGYMSRPFSSLIDVNDSVMLGSWYQAGAWYPSGSFDEVSIWDFELSTAQASLLYNSGAGINAMAALPSESI